MRSDVVDTVCVRCDDRYPADPSEPHRCACGGPLELDREGTAPDHRVGPVGGLWTFADALPPGPRIDLGAGGTPRVDAPAFDAEFKLETCNPTGSFKDRGAAVTISRAVALGVETIREDSSGNAGLAIATHAARAGIDATIFVPATGATPTQSAIEATGATLVAVEGDRSAAERACLTGAGWYASHAWRPEFYAGTATLAWELVAEAGDTPIDAVVLPVGHGTLLLGAFRGFETLRRSGRIEATPRLYAVQPDDAGSLTRGDVPVDPSIAPGVRIDRPAREAQVREAIETSGGGIVPVAPGAVEPTRKRLAKAGFDVCSTAALGVAGRRALVEEGREPADRRVVVVLTGRSRDR